jgi:hypothetical protein
MSANEMVQSSLTLLEQMIEEPEAVLQALGPADRNKINTQLSELADQATVVRTEGELMGVAGGFHRLIGETPELANLLQSNGFGSRGAPKRRPTRSISEEQHRNAYCKSQYVREHAARLRNRMVECREVLESVLRESSQGEQR